MGSTPSETQTPPTWPRCATAILTVWPGEWWTLKGQGLTPTRRQKIPAWEARVHQTGATVDDVAELERILKQAIVLRDITGEDVYNSGKYQREHRHIELIFHNGHAWSKDLHFPQFREVHLYEGEAIRQATRREPKAVWLLGGGPEGRQLTVD